MCVNWTIKAKISATQAPNDLARTQVYTDGSKIDGGVGAGVSVWQKNREIFSKSFGLPPYCTVYQAELFAIQKAFAALEYLHIRGGQLLFIQTVFQQSKHCNLRTSRPFNALTLSKLSIDMVEITTFASIGLKLMSAMRATSAQTS